MRRAAAAAIVLALMASVALAQGRDLKDENTRRDQRANDLRRYHALLDAYVAGDDAHSVDVLAQAEWDQTRLHALFQKIDGLNDPGAPWTALRYCAAALLHADVAIKLTTAQVPTDLLHYEFGANLLRQGIREHGDALRPFAVRWYVNLAGYLRNNSALGVAERLLRIARDRIRDSGPILSASGTLAELLATNYALAGRARVTVSQRDWGFPMDAVAERRLGNLNDAADWLRQAAALDPGDDVVRVHLGRVLALKGNDDEALKVLSAVRDHAADAATAYLAAIFLGGLHERESRLDDAAAAYRAAIARFPLGHAARIGLSVVLQRTGKGGESREVVHELVTERLGETKEPLWWYLFDPPGVAEAELEALRKVGRR